MRYRKLDALRAARRGLGPPRHSVALPLSCFHELHSGDDPWVIGGPVGPLDTLAIGRRWLLREIVVSRVLRDHVRVGTNVVTILTHISMLGDWSLVFCGLTVPRSSFSFIHAASTDEE